MKDNLNIPSNKNIDKLDFPSEFDIKILNKIENTDWQIQKKLLFLWWLNNNLNKFFWTKAVLVGGSSVELYSAGLYQSQDIDIIYVNNEDITKLLKKVWFQISGRYWKNEKLDILLEAPSGELEWDKSKVLQIENVIDWVTLISYVIWIEDIVIDRINAYIHWKDNESWLQAKNMLEWSNSEWFDTKYVLNIIDNNKDIKDFLENKDKLNLLSLIKWLEK